MKRFEPLNSTSLRSPWLIIVKLVWNITCSLLFLYREVKIFDIKENFSVFCCHSEADPTYLVHSINMSTLYVIVFHGHQFFRDFFFSYFFNVLQDIFFVKSSLLGRFWQIKQNARFYEYFVACIFTSNCDEKLVEIKVFRIFIRYNSNSQNITLSKKKGILYTREN